MKKPFLAILVLFLATTPACTQNTAPKLDSLMDAYVKVLGFNGTVFAATKGTVIFEKGYGYKNKRTNARNDSNTIFQIGSIHRSSLYVRRHCSANSSSIIDSHGYSLKIDRIASSYLPASTKHPRRSFHPISRIASCRVLIPACSAVSRRYAIVS